MKLIFLHLTCFVFKEVVSGSLVDSRIPEQTGNNCTIKASNTETAYIGWPYAFTCAELFEKYVKKPSDIIRYDDDYYANPSSSYVDYDESEHKYNATCRIIDLDNNRIVFEKTVAEGDHKKLVFDIMINESTPRNYSMGGWLSGLSKDCVAFECRLRIKALSNLTCQEAYQASKPISHEAIKEKSFELNCAVYRKGHIRIPQNSKTKWYRNCDALPDNHSLRGRWNNKLILPRLTYDDHPGNYSCAVTHNGMTQFITHFKFCVSPPRHSVQHTVKCAKEEYFASIGKDVVLKCNGTIDNQMADSVMTSIVWAKVSKGGNPLTCTNYYDRLETSENNTRATCIYRKQTHDICYNHVPSEAERNIPQQMFLMDLTIRNVQKGDLGTYEVAFHSSGGGSKVVTANMNLTEYTVPMLVGNAAAVGASTIAFVVFLILGVWLCWWKQIYFKVQYRRRFGEYCPDNREYGAFFSYHFSYDLDKFAQNQVRDVTTFVRDELESQGYKIFDETKDNCEIAPRAEQQLAYMKQSHRVVIILTSEYVKDHWKVFTLQQGFEEMIKSESKLIFIVVPGVREHIKQHAVEDQTLEMIKSAMNVNYVIEWCNGKKFNQKLFSLQLELAMPKLRSHKATRHTSTSSSVMSQVFYKNAFKGFKRTFSNETGTTEINSPVSTQEDYIEISEEPSL